MSRGLRLLAGCLAGGSLLVASACGGSSRPDYNIKGDGVIVPVQDRITAPDLTGRSLLSTGDVSLKQFAGHVIVVNYWGAWCGPCQDEADGLAAAWKTLEPKGVQFVGLDTRDKDSEAKRFLTAHGMQYPQIVDPDGTLQIHWTPLPIQGSPPNTVVLDANGKVAARFLGEVTDSKLTTVVTQVLAEKKA